MLAELSDVQRLLPEQQIPSEETEYVTALIEEAGDLVEAYCRTTFPTPAPDRIRRVVARMVARAYTDNDGSVPEGASSTSVTAGPFSRSFGFEPGATSSGVWLSANDKQRLRGYRGRAFTVWPYAGGIP